MIVLFLHIAPRGKVTQQKYRAEDVCSIDLFYVRVLGYMPVTTESQRGWSSWSQSYIGSCECWELNLDPLQVQALNC